MAITFQEIRKYISRTARVSICFEDGHYYNYTLISDIPEGRYGNLSVYGVGMIDVEFPLDIYAEPDPGQQAEQADCMVGGGLEIVLHAAPRPDIAKKWEKGLRFGDLRDYIQIGGNFSVVLREGWSREEYEWRDDIPKVYNRMFVWGIGIEANPKEAANPRFMHMDTTLAMRMVIVLSETPRRLLEPRICGDCGIEAPCGSRQTCPVVLEGELTPEELATWRRIKAEPESLLSEEADAIS